jgi:hypothetical protein
MAGISDRALTTAYGRLASLLGVSLASARRKVDIRAEQLLAESEASGHNNHNLLTSLLEAVGNDENFMVED